jgi:hypothetical protein
MNGRPTPTFCPSNVLSHNRHRCCSGK